MPAALYSNTSSVLDYRSALKCVKPAENTCMTAAICINPAVTEIHNRDKQQICPLIPTLFNLLLWPWFNEGNKYFQTLFVADKPSEAPYKHTETWVNYISALFPLALSAEQSLDNRTTSDEQEKILPIIKRLLNCIRSTQKRSLISQTVYRPVLHELCTPL